MDTLTELWKLRSNQLQEESTLDARIIDGCGSCPEITVQFLLTYREYNRKWTDKVMKESWYHRPGAYRNQLKAFHEVIHGVLLRDERNLCEYLRHYQQDMENKMKADQPVESKLP